MTKVGGGPLFDALYQDAAHDVAVSIRGIPDTRTPPPRKNSVVCHHLNYFVSEDRLNAMTAVDWSIE